MVIECESCSTRFHLADARIPSKGARVRCSNCHHRFHVTPPPKTPDSENGADQNSASAAPESAPAAKRQNDPDLDNPEFLFDTPDPGTTSPSQAEQSSGESAAAANPGETSPSQTLPGEPLPAPASDEVLPEPQPDETRAEDESSEDFGTVPEFESDPSSMLRDAGEADEEEEPLSAGSQDSAPSFELERPSPGQGYDAPAQETPALDPPAPDVEVAQDSVGADLGLPDDDMPELEIERGQADEVDSSTGPATPSDSPSFDDVLSKDLDDDDDDTMSAWDSLGVPATPAPIEVQTVGEPPSVEHGDNAISAAHAAAARSAPTVESEPGPRGKAHVVVQAVSLALALLLIAGAVRGLVVQSGGGGTGPDVITGAGWRAQDVEAFQLHDLSRRRILVVRGSLRASTSAPAPKLGAILLDRDGRRLDAEPTAVLRRLEGEELTPEALTARLRPALGEPIVESLPAAPVEDGQEAPGIVSPPAAGNSDQNPAEVEGFTLLIPDPPVEARRFELDLARR